MANDADRLFNRMVVGVSAFMLLYMVFRFKIDGDLYRAVGPLIIAAGGALAWLIRRSGRRQPSFVFYVWVVWLALTHQAYLRTGMANPTTHGYVVLMLLGGWLLGMRQAVYLGIASSLVMLVMALTMSYELWTPPPAGSPLGYWMALSVVWGTGLMVLSWIVSAHRQQSEHLVLLNQSLRESIAAQEAQNTALHASEKRFNTIIDASPIPMAISRITDGCFLEVNPAWVRALGWTSQETVGKTSIDIGFWLSAADRERWITSFSEVGRSLGYQLQYRNRAGEIRSAQMFAEAIEFNGERQVLVMFVDDTERKRVDAQLHELNAALEHRVEERTAELAKSNLELSAAMETLQRTQEELLHAEKLSSLGKLVAGVAHELNTPLGNALTAVTAVHDMTAEFSRELEAGTVKRSQLNQFVAQVIDGSDLTTRSLRRAAELLSSFKQVAIDQASERRRGFDLAAMISELVDTLRPTLKGSPWEIQLAIPADIHMESYPGPLDQILINLIMNATIHAFAGRSEGKVIISATRLPDEWVELVCADDGVGIAPEHLGRVFDPFFTSRLGQGGSGLGLAIAHRLTTQVLGGQVRVESVLNEGTRFVLRLPLVAPAHIA